jgi:feruloyl esterase
MKLTNPHVREPSHMASVPKRLLLASAVSSLLTSTVLAAPSGLSESESIVQIALPNRTLACENLTGLKLRDTRIIAATSVPAGSYTFPGNQTFNDLPAFCRVIGQIYPAINFEVLLPASAGSWNGKFAASGSGGTGGYVNYGQLPAVKDGMTFNLRKGYAVAATDQGHLIGTTGWLMDAGRLVDWGSRANHEVAMRAKAIIKSYYGMSPRYSYFEGCSGGGQQAMMQAQRYPQDYDGLVAGAPANNWSALMVGWLWNGAATLIDPPAKIPASKLPAINAAVLAQCDGADGLKDWVVLDPPACKFDPAQLACTSGDGPSCLTAAQLEGLKKIYQGPVNPRTGERIYPALSVGGESTWTPTVAGPLPTGIAVTWFRWAIFEDPNWDWKTFDYDKDWDQARAKLSSISDSIDPDLRPFRDMGKKLIMWHGWGDHLIAAQNSVDYYNSVIELVASENPGKDAVKATQEFARLYMNPGLGHCSGGPGTETFDPLAALEQWVENGIAPDQIPSAHITNGVEQYTRPLCPYPAIPFYKAGDATKASSFECRVP